MLKMYRNLWFYIALFGLAPPVQKQQQLSLRQISNQAGNISSTHSSLMALQAVGGTYMWNSQWSAAATLITHGTPPLVSFQLCSSLRAEYCSKQIANCNPYL